MSQERFAQEDPLSREVIGAAIAVHRELGPGLLESAYRLCMEIELAERSIPFQSEVNVPMFYRGRQLPGVYRLDLLIGGVLIVELKAVEKLLPVHEAQLLTYLRLAKQRVGLLFNFNSAVLRDAIVRRVL